LNVEERPVTAEIPVGKNIRLTMASPRPDKVVVGSDMSDEKFRFDY
jgi:hypothetical protein